ncbi:MAG: phosphohistidine phosphatase, SixA [Nitrospirae bacterium]|nr:phosphohistidine phosphatase, SixA [Nitrospirota bacterium]
MMFLYLVRHADAKNEEEDPVRALSEKGIQDITRIASYIWQLNLKVLGIFHSSKLRAKQTAEILFEYLKPLKGLSEVDGLSPLDNPDVWAARLRGIHEDAVLVGHLPHLARLASLLLCGSSEKNIVTFRTAGVICLERDDAGAWSLQWMLNPDIVLGEKGIGYSCDSL